MTSSDFNVRQATWDTDRDALRDIRERVFIQEQQVPVELEWDAHDNRCIHLLATDAEANPIGTARMLADGHIGRMAVLPDWRRHGVGSALLAMLLDIARQQDLPRVFLFAQTSAIGFYERHDFTITSDEFMDAGIPHREMARDLGQN